MLTKTYVLFKTTLQPFLLIADQLDMILYTKSKSESIFNIQIGDSKLIYLLSYGPIKLSWILAMSTHETEK